jgi:hypothetical protein
MHLTSKWWCGNRRMIFFFIVSFHPYSIHDWWQNDVDVWDIVTTPLWGKCEVATHTPENGSLESFGTPENSEDDYRAQNILHWDVFYTVGKVLKCRCLKWPRMSHLNICNPSYGQKKGRESNWQFNSRPLKVENRPEFDIVKWSATRRWKALKEGYKFGSDLVPIGGWGEKLWLSKVPRVQIGTVSELHFGSPGTKNHSDVASAGERREYYMGEGGGFLRVPAVVSQMSPSARGLSQRPRVFPNVN